MKKIIDIIFALTMFLSLIFISLNIELITTKYNINIFGLNLETNINLYIITYFVLALTIIYTLARFGNSFVNARNEKLEKELQELKYTMMEKKKEVLDKLYSENKLDFDSLQKMILGIRGDIDEMREKNK